MRFSFGLDFLEIAALVMLLILVLRILCGQPVREAVAWLCYRTVILLIHPCRVLVDLCAGAEDVYRHFGQQAPGPHPVRIVMLTGHWIETAGHPLAAAVRALRRSYITVRKVSVLPLTDGVDTLIEFTRGLDKHVPTMSGCGSSSGGIPVRVYTTDVYASLALPRRSTENGRSWILFSVLSDDEHGTRIRLLFRPHLEAFTEREDARLRELARTIALLVRAWSEDSAPLAA